MIAEADLEGAFRAAAAAAATAVARGAKTKQKRSRVRPRSSTAVDDHGGWSRVDHSCSQVFWPRFQDFCLVTAGVRCAVLLDSRRAPRGSPPLAGVLRELQDSHPDCSSPVGCDGRGHSVASLGLLRLEGSCFLVNRSMLARRLGEAFACPRPHADAASPPSMPPRGHAAATQPAAERSLAIPEREAHCGERAAIPAVQPTLGTFDRCPSSAWVTSGQGLDCAFVDVKKSLNGPVVRTDALAPRLYAALRSTFGGAAGDVQAAVVNVEAATSADPPPSPSTQRETPVTAASFFDRGKGGNVGEEPSEGALWLRDWKNTDLALDSRSLSESLGSVGLPGFAGWLLEYPVIYCCSSITGGGQRSEDGHGAEAEHHVGNCLASVPLTVYSLRLDVGYGASCPPRESNSSSFEAFSFSVPQTVWCPAEAAGDDDDDGDDDDGARRDSVEDQGQAAVIAGLNCLVDTFLQRFEGRIANHRRCSCKRHQHCLERLSVSKRTETLDLVAL